MTAVISTCQQSFDTWDNLGECPYCGSPDIEIDMDGFYVCDDCDSRSADILTDDMELETWMINNLERFDWQEIIDKDHVGGE